MKRFFILGWIGLGLFLTSSCQDQTARQISIKIVIDSLPKDVQTAYLDLLKPSETRTIDTATIEVPEGKVTFHLFSTKEPSLLRIRMGNNYNLLLIGGESDLTVQGNFQQEELAIKGSEASQELNKFINRLNTQNTALNRLSESIYNPQKPLSDSLNSIKTQQLQQEKQSIKDFILEKAQNTKNPNMALFALSILNDKSLMDEGKAVLENLPDRFPGNFQIQDAVNYFQKKLNNQGNNLTTDIGDQAPNLSFPNPRGEKISLSDFKNKYVFIDFWASWCAPCREANPQLVKIYNRFKNKNFAMIGVSLDNKKTAWKEAIQADHLLWPQMSDLKGWSATPAAIYNIKAIPANFLIDPEGIIIAKNLKANELEDKLNKLFN